jgi:hypothetical protein
MPMPDGKIDDKFYITPPDMPIPRGLRLGQQRGEESD